MRSNSRCAALLAVLALAATAAWAQQSYPSGTAFEENFGNAATNAVPCWVSGPSSCVQPWVVTAGSGQQIVSAPSGYGFAGANVLSLPSAATALALQTYGTLPAIPANSAFTLTMTVATSGYSAGSNVLLLKNVAGQSEVLVGIGYGNGFWFNGGSVCAASTDVAHTIEVTTNGTTMSFYIDGVQCGASISDPGYRTYQIDLDGNTGENLWVGTVTISGAAVTGSWPPSTFVDLTGSGTASSSSILDRCGNSANGWTLSSGTNDFTVSSGAPTLPSAVSVCGVSYSGAGNWLVYTNPAQVSGAYIGSGYEVAATTGVVASWGFLANLSVSSISSLATSDFATIRDSANAERNINICGGTAGATSCSGATGSDTELLVCGEQSSGSDAPGCISVNQATYWFTFDVTASGNDQISVYDWPSLALVGTINLTDTPPTAAGATTFYLGPTGAENPGETVTWKYSDIIIEYADAQFPVLPPTAVASCPHTLMTLGVGCG